MPLDAAKSSPTALTLALASDAPALKAYLDGLPLQSQGDTPDKRNHLSDEDSESEESSKEISLEAALLSSDEHRRTPLFFASIYNDVDCARVLFDAASRAAPRTLQKMLDVVEKCRGYSPLQAAIARAKAEMILAYIHAGVDFWTTTIPGYDTALSDGEYAIAKLTKYACREPAEYLPILKEVLRAMADRDPNFDINAAIEPEKMDTDFEEEEEEDDEDGEDSLGSADELFSALAIGEEINEEGEENEEESDSTVEGEQQDGQEGAGNGNGDDHSANTPSSPEPRRNTPRARRQRRGGRSGGGLFPDIYTDDFLAGLYRGSFPGGPEPKRTLLSIAARNGAIDALLHLLGIGAVPEGNVLHRAISYLSDRRDRLRDVYGDEIETEGTKSKSANEAAGLASFQALLDAGADVNAVEVGSEDTPLHAAARYNCIPAVEMLLKLKSDTTLRNVLGRTPLEVAKEAGYEQVAEMLTRQRRLSRLLSRNDTNSFKAREEDIPEAEQCLVCFVRRKEVILAPCGHKATCRRCTRIILSQPESERLCPMDRTPIESFITAVFDV